MIKKESVISFFFFSGSKSVVFFTPLAVLFLLGDGYYVLVEQLFATSLLIWPALALGMTSAYSYFFLERQDRRFIPFYYRYLLVLLGVLSLICCAIYLLGYTTESLRYMPFLVFLMCFSYFISAVHKCNSDVIRSSSFDAFPYACFFLFLILSFWETNFGSFFMIFALVFMLFYVFHLSAKSSLVNGQGEINDADNVLSSNDIKFYFAKGVHSFVVSWLAIAVVMFPRVFAADFTTLDESKELYLALRFGTFFVLIYQFVQIKLYAKVFKISSEMMRKVLFIYWFALCLVLLLVMISELTLSYYFAVLYTGMWVMVSMLELQVVRKGVQMAVVKGVLLLSPCITLVFFLDSFYHFIICSIALLCVYLFIQCYSVYKLSFSLQVMAIPLISGFGLLYYA